MATSTLLPHPSEVTVLSPEPDTRTPARSRARDEGFFGEALKDTPWRVGDVVRLATRQGLAIIGLVIAWVGCSGTLVFRDQAGWTAGAVLALLVGSTGGVAWVLSGLGAVGRERRWVRQQISALYLTEPVTGPASAVSHVTGQGMVRYHRADCDVVRGKEVRLVDSRLDPHLKPCGMCLS